MSKNPQVLVLGVSPAFEDEDEDEDDSSLEQVFSTKHQKC
jgi:hypothetical protein